MPTKLGAAFARDFTGLPTHMSTMDYAIWTRYRKQLDPAWFAMYFDAGLGDGRDPGKVNDATLTGMWETITQKRADVILQGPGRVRILELRENAQANAIGRLLTYQMLWLRDPVLKGTLELELATNIRDPDVADMCALHHIVYTVL